MPACAGMTGREIGVTGVCSGCNAASHCPPLFPPRHPGLDPGFGVAPNGSKKSLAPCQARGGGKSEPKKPFSYTNLFGYVNCLFENQKGTNHDNSFPKTQSFIRHPSKGWGLWFGCTRCQPALA